AGAAAGVDPCAVAADERFTELVDGLRRDGHAAVPDAQERPPARAAGGDLDMAYGTVVADGVVDQVAAQTFQQDLFAADRRRPQVGAHGEVHAVEAGRRDLGEVDAVPGAGARLAAGQRQ